jgi:hypothetical protein
VRLPQLASGHVSNRRHAGTHVHCHVRPGTHTRHMRAYRIGLCASAAPHTPAQAYTPPSPRRGRTPPPPSPTATGAPPGPAPPAACVCTCVCVRMRVPSRPRPHARVRPRRLARPRTCSCLPRRRLCETKRCRTTRIWARAPLSAAPLSAGPLSASRRRRMEMQDIRAQESGPPGCGRAGRAGRRRGSTMSCVRANMRARPRREHTARRGMEWTSMSSSRISRQACARVCIMRALVQCVCACMYACECTRVCVRSTSALHLAEQLPHQPVRRPAPVLARLQPPTPRLPRPAFSLEPAPPTPHSPSRLPVSEPAG